MPESVSSTARGVRPGACDTEEHGACLCPPVYAAAWPDATDKRIARDLLPTHFNFPETQPLKSLGNSTISQKIIPQSVEDG